MLAFAFLALLATLLVVALVVRDHRNSGIDDGWYGHSDRSTDRSGSFFGPFA